MEDVYTCICHIWSHCNQSCNTEHSMHIWHISLNKYGCHIVHVCSTELPLLCTYRPYTSAHITQKFSLWHKLHKYGYKYEKINMSDKCKQLQKLQWLISKCAYISYIYANLSCMTQSALCSLKGSYKAQRVEDQEPPQSTVTKIRTAIPPSDYPARQQQPNTEKHANLCQFTWSQKLFYAA